MLIWLENNTKVNLHAGLIARMYQLGDNNPMIRHGMYHRITWVLLQVYHEFFYGNWALTYCLGMKMGHTTKQVQSVAHHWT